MGGKMNIFTQFGNVIYDTNN